MKKIVNRILNVFKRKDRKNVQFNNIYQVCQSDSKEVGEYCRLEGLSK